MSTDFTPLQYDYNIPCLNQVEKKVSPCEKEVLFHIPPPVLPLLPLLTISQTLYRYRESFLIGKRHAAQEIFEVIILESDRKSDEGRFVALVAEEVIPPCREIYMFQ